MKKLISFATVLAAGIATPALAQDGSGVELYAGVIAGYDHLGVEAFGDTGGNDGLVYGGVAGVQINRAGLILGIEGEVAGSTTEQSAEDLFVLGDELEVRAGRDLYIGARVGGYLMPNLMVYGKGGYTNARVTADYGAPAGGLEVSENLEGYRLGAGVEVGAGRVRWRGEYRFSDYGDFDVNGVTTGITPQRHQVVVGAIFAF